MKITRFLAAISLALFSFAARADYTTLNWGIDRTTTPYNIGVNLGGVWYPFGSISAGGSVGGGVFSGTSAPTSPILYQWWLDKSAALYALKMYDGAQWPTLATLDTTNHRWITGSVPVTNFGGACNDATLTAAAASNRSIVIPSGIICSVGASMTLTLKAQLVIEQGAGISVASGQTLTFSTGSEIIADRVQIFFGAGTVLGIAFPKPEWFDGGDTAAAFQAAHDSAKYAAINWSNVRPSKYGVDIGCKLYEWNKTVNLSPTTLFPMKFVSDCGPMISGARITMAETFTGDTAIDIIAPPNTLDQAAQFEVGGFQLVNNSTASVANGIRIGKDDGTSFNPSTKNLIHDIEFENFQASVLHRNGRMIDFERIGSFSSAPGSVCYRAHPTTAPGSFVGDVELEKWNCIPCRVDMASCVNTRSVEFIADSPGTGVAGVRMNDFIGYYSNKAINGVATNGAAITDIWINSGSQFDAKNEGGIIKNGAIAEFAAIGTDSVVQNINIGNIYSRGSNPSFTSAAYIFFADDSAAAGNGVNSINIAGAWLANSTTRAVLLYNVHGANIDTIIDASGSSGQTAIQIHGSSKDISVRLNAQSCIAPYIYDYGVLVEDTSDRVRVLPSVLSSCATTPAAVTSTGTQIDVSGLYPKNTANGPIVATSDGTLASPGDAELPLGAALNSNVYYSGGWKYRGNGYGGFLKFDVLGGMNAFTVPNNTGGAGAAATPVNNLAMFPNGMNQFPTYGAGVMQTDASGYISSGPVPSTSFADGNTGTGAVVHAASPTLVTPILGAATATSVTHTPVTIASLGTCNAGAKGAVRSVSDGDASLAWGATAVNSGSGATYYIVNCNGTNWTVVGK